jgi:hypothetical protein
MKAASPLLFPLDFQPLARLTPLFLSTSRSASPILAGMSHDARDWLDGALALNRAALLRTVALSWSIVNHGRRRWIMWWQFTHTGQIT